MIAYGFIASVLPVWMLLCPRDYLSTFMKIGTILLLALGILVVLPPLRMPAVTRFIDGTGPVFAGKLFPFAFITIACGAISGFHALVASGTTPKMLTRESDARLIGYGGMLMESFVAVMAMCAAAVLDPGVYFAINAPLATLGGSVEAAAETIRELGLHGDAGADDRARRRRWARSTLLSRTGGAPSLAVGMAHIFSGAFGQGLMALWYHFAIMFEALFILTTVDTGTRVGRFMLQELAGHVWAPLGRTSWYPEHRLRLRRWSWRAGATSWCRACSIRSAGSTRSGRCSASATSCSRRWRSASARRSSSSAGKARYAWVDAAAARVGAHW